MIFDIQSDAIRYRELLATKLKRLESNIEVKLVAPKDTDPEWRHLEYISEVTSLCVEIDAMIDGLPEVVF